MISSSRISPSRTTIRILRSKRRFRYEFLQRIGVQRTPWNGEEGSGFGRALFLVSPSHRPLRSIPWRSIFGSRLIPAPMRYFMRFHAATGMHAGYLPSYPASHGCVRMPEQNAIQFFRAVEVGTPVHVFGRTLRTRDYFEYGPQPSRPLPYDRGYDPRYDPRFRNPGYDPGYVPPPDWWR